MNKAYYRINNGDGWENYPSAKTPLNKHNLDKGDVALDEIDNRVIRLDTSKFDKSEAQLLVKDITFNLQTGILTKYYYNGSKEEINTGISKLNMNLRFDSENQTLYIVNADGTEDPVDLSVFITNYEFQDSDTIAHNVSNGIVTSVVKDGSIGEKHLRPDYLADIKVESAKAEASAKAASQSADKAGDNAKLAQSYAVGTSGQVRPNDAEDNAKKYAENAQKAYEDLRKNNVTGVKGAAETEYRKGDVSLTPEDIGALPITGGNVTGLLNPQAGLAAAGTDGYIAYPEGGTFNLRTSEQNGRLCIALPVKEANDKNTMISFTVTIYNYESMSSLSYNISGYVYPGHAFAENDVTAWHKCTAVCVGDARSSYAGLNVYFCLDSAEKRFVVAIGEYSTIWKYLQAAVHDVVVGYNNYSYEEWYAGWRVYIENDRSTLIDSKTYTPLLGARAVTDAADKTQLNYISNTEPGTSRRPPAVWDGNIIKKGHNLQLYGNGNSGLNTNLYNDMAIEIREANEVLEGTGALYEMPGIAFHWGNRHGKVFGMLSDGTFAIVGSDGGYGSHIIHATAEYAQKDANYGRNIGITLNELINRVQLVSSLPSDAASHPDIMYCIPE